MIRPKVEAVNFDAEAQRLAAEQKQQYVNLDTDTSEGAAAGDPEYQTEEQFHAEAAATESSMEASSRYRRTGKLAFQMTDFLLPRGLGMWLEVPHKELKADPEDHQDIIEAYTAVMEYYDYDFDNPVAALVLVLGTAYGLKAYEASSTRKAALKAAAAKPKPAASDDADTQAAPSQRTPHTPDANGAIHVEQEDVSDDEPGAKFRNIKTIPTCQAPDCAKMLNPHQKKFCSKECRMKMLHANNKKHE